MSHYIGDLPISDGGDGEAALAWPFLHIVTFSCVYMSGLFPLPIANGQRFSFPFVFGGRSSPLPAVALFSCLSNYLKKQTLSKQCFAYYYYILSYFLFLYRTEYRKGFVRESAFKNTVDTKPATAHTRQMLILCLRLAVARNILARLRHCYAIAPSAYLRVVIEHAVFAVRQARAALKADRQARQAAFALRCQAASAKRQAASAKRQAKRKARQGRLTIKEAERFSREQAATQRLKALEERQRKARQARQALQMAIGAEKIRRAKEKSENRLTRLKRSE
ncbi:hypothetical protein [Brevundimonas sp.]|uniref:hypothetical protein n=1 Tax=Brevundimonas sp. TaxID=1871086 RepID=UPI003783BAA1